ncbi:MAG: DNA mismatch repair protein MutS [Deltaproteobacteria bacterium]|nr:DNA mismatch repair protein MutS [Deltaproteobacteria bacterium]
MSDSFIGERDELIASVQSNAEHLPPMMRCYLGYKADYPEHLLLLQVGDFYELFFEDATVAAAALDVRLTSRNKNSENSIPMCGVPVHAIDAYIPKLLAKGFSCVIVSQTSEAKAKGPVLREITRIITPGVRYEGEGLDEKKFNYLAACALNARESGALVFVDVSTGSLRVGEVENLENLLEMLERVSPSELILPSTLFGVSTKENQNWLRKVRKKANELNCHIVMRPFVVVSERDISRRLEMLLRENSSVGVGAASDNSRGLSQEACSALAAAINYVEEVSFGPLARIFQFTVEKSNGVVFIDAATRRNLELFETRIDGTRKNSLIDLMDLTQTAMGSRLLREWLSAPSCELDVIESRQAAVEELVRLDSSRARLRELLAAVRDIDRLMSRVTTMRATPRDLRVLADSLSELPEIRRFLGECSSEMLKRLLADFDTLEDICRKLNSALVDEPSNKINEGGIIREGFSSNVDDLRELSGEAKQWLLKLEAEEKIRTGISGLKVRYNNVFGYFFEVTKSHLSKVPSHYQRKQTLANAERFSTDELKSLEVSVLSAKARQIELEKELFIELRSYVAGEAHRIQATSRGLSLLDVFAALAELAHRRNYCRPKIVQGTKLHIKAGRHPVIEMVIGAHNFVPNDCTLDSEGEGKYFALLTGPNMGGKSTYLRQVGLIQLLAQIGSFVPAESAELSLVDRIFTRIGAADDIARGDSTFMVEMREATTIVKRATERSLVLIDEIGRGTATADGLAIATSIAEWLHDCIGAKTIFATHFHQLTSLAEAKKGVSCITVGIVEDGDEIIFTHRIENGTADRSYGLEVARLAGLPQPLLQRARMAMSSFENCETLTSDLFNQPLSSQIAVFADNSSVPPAREDVPSSNAEHELVVERILSFDINSMTPLQALRELEALQNELSQ